jgi:hypothetical protein
VAHSARGVELPLHLFVPYCTIDWYGKGYLSAALAVPHTLWNVETVGPFWRRGWDARTEGQGVQKPGRDRFLTVEDGEDVASDVNQVSEVAAVKNFLRITPTKVVFVAITLGFLYVAGLYVEGLRMQSSVFDSDFGDLVNRNLLAPWQPDQERFAIMSGIWCAPGTDAGWPKTRSRCALVGGAVQGCSPFTYGRSCAVIGTPKVFFDDPHFRESLRVALSDLCAVFRQQGVRSRTAPTLPRIYDTLGCSSRRPVSLDVYIRVRDSNVTPPYTIQPGSTLVAAAYFSARSKDITLLSTGN